MLFYFSGTYVYSHTEKREKKCGCCYGRGGGALNGITTLLVSSSQASFRYFSSRSLRSLWRSIRMEFFLSSKVRLGVVEGYRDLFMPSIRFSVATIFWCNSRTLLLNSSSRMRLSFVMRGLYTNGASKAPLTYIR